MICTTVRKGKECSFAGKSRCGYILNTCFPIVEKCNGCNNIEVFNEKTYCKSYMSPEMTWKTGCGLATNKVLKVEDTKKLNPLKASKKASKGKKKK